MRSEKLRIAVWHNLPSGGGKRALWHHVSGLLKRGHELECWCPDMADKEYLPLGKLCREHVLPVKPAPFKRAPKFFGWLADFQQAKAGIAAMRDHCAACAAEINRGQFDVVLANSCYSMTVPSIARWLKIPKAIYLGEPNRRYYEALDGPPWAAPAPKDDALTAGLAQLTANSLKFQYRRTQMREELDNARHFDRILVNSFFSRESVLRAFGLESEVCYLGIDSDFFHPTHEPVEKYVVGLGSLHRHKGAKLAIRSLAMLPPAQRPKLLWIGNFAGDIQPAELMAEAGRLGVELEIKLMVTDGELISLLSRATAMLYTSRLEPFGLAPLEANACGTPVIALPEGGVRETIVHGENGLLVSNARPETIAAAVSTILQDPELAARLRGQCRNIILTRWGMAASIENLERALLRVISDKNSVRENK